jgi:hypothetical protein
MTISLTINDIPDFLKDYVCYIATKNNLLKYFDCLKYSHKNFNH